MTTSTQHKQKQQQQLSQPYQDIKLPDDAQSCIRDLIFSYLVFNCYEDTAKSFARGLMHGTSPTEGQKISNPKVSKSWENIVPSKPTGSSNGNASSKKTGADEDGDFEMTDASSSTMVNASGSRTYHEIIQSLKPRKRMIQLVSSGELEKAIELCLTTFPQVVVPLADLSSSSNTRLKMSFELHCQHFIELIRQGKQADALLYGQNVLSKFGTLDNCFLEKLREVGALLAYESPESSSLSHFLSQQHRDAVSEALNSAILVSLGQPEKPALETCIKQLIAVRDTVADLNEPSNKGKKTERWNLSDFLG